MKLQTFAGLTVALIFACIPLRAHAQAAAGGMGSAAESAAKQGRPERRRSDDAEHGLLHDGVASRTRVAAGSASGGWCAFDAVGARRTFDAWCGAGYALSAGRTGDGGCTFDAVDARRCSGGTGNAFSPRLLRRCPRCRVRRQYQVRRRCRSLLLAGATNAADFVNIA